MSVIPNNLDATWTLLGCMNSSVMRELVGAVAPTLNLNAGTVARLPVPNVSGKPVSNIITALVQIFKEDWDEQETSWDFVATPLMMALTTQSVEEQFRLLTSQWHARVESARQLESENDSIFLEAFGVEPSLSRANREVTLWSNPASRYGRSTQPHLMVAMQKTDSMKDFLSYAVGCMLGRYCLGHPGLVLANQGDTLREYLAHVPSPSFMPDADNVIPIIDGEWFEDDIVSRFRQFLRVSFGDKDFDANLHFIEDALGKDLRKYFVTDFYKDHVQRYKKRPIYWMFSSPKGSFNALIYMHRYSPSTVGTVLNDYLREFQEKQKAELANQERIAAAASSPRNKARADKEADRIRNVLLELDSYEHDVLWPLATQQIEIDLDDGVKANYPKFGAALKKIPGLEASDE